MKDTIKYAILKYLDSQVDLFNPDPKFVFAGTICRDIHDLTNVKESVIERRCRELAEEGRIEKAYMQVNGKGPKCVTYRIKIPTDPKDLREHYQSMGRIVTEIVTMPNGERRAVEKVI